MFGNLLMGEPIGLKPEDLPLSSCQYGPVLVMKFNFVHCESLSEDPAFAANRSSPVVGTISPTSVTICHIESMLRIISRLLSAQSS